MSDYKKLPGLPDMTEEEAAECDPEAVDLYKTLQEVVYRLKSLEEKTKYVPEDRGDGTEETVFTISGSNRRVP